MKLDRSNLVATFALLSLSACASGGDDADSAESAATAPDSAYTSLEHDDCRTLTGPDFDSTWEGSRECAGMGGHVAIVHASDGRENVILRSPTRELDLQIWSELGAFGHLGPKAEWRGRFVAPGKVDPYAVIVRYFQQNPENPLGPPQSFMVVSRVTRDAACIVGVVPGSQPDHNVRAREIADANRDFVCPADRNGQVTSAYTSLEQGCTVLRPPSNEGEDGGSMLCRGMGPYATIIESGDGRQNVVVRSFTGGDHSLDTWAVVPSFGHLGPNAEWRGTFVAPGEVDPSSLIVRYIADVWNDDRRDFDHHHYLFVAKVMSSRVCVQNVVDVDRHGANANVRARQLADAGRNRPCPGAMPDPE